MSLFVKRMFSVQDIEVGEKVKVLNHPGHKAGVVTKVEKELLYAVAFDDGSFCDSVDTETVTFVDAVGPGGELSVNAAVKVNWEGELCSGIYKETNTIYWYTVKCTKVKEPLELARADLTRL